MEVLDFEVSQFVEPQSCAVEEDKDETVFWVRGVGYHGADFLLGKDSWQFLFAFWHDFFGRFSFKAEVKPDSAGCESDRVGFFSCLNHSEAKLLVAFS